MTNLVNHEEAPARARSWASLCLAAIVLCAVHPDATARAVSPDSYEVFALPKEHPDDGPRTVEVDPSVDGGIASPFGWHDADGVPGADYTITRGNNVYAYTDTDHDDVPDPGSSPDGGPGLEFHFPLDLDDDPVDYRDAAVTNAFYWFNIMHDVLHGYGFDENAGNFQENNYDRGGIEGDPIRVEVQDGLLTNGLLVTIPPDGESPVVETSIWTLTSPRRDGALSAYANAYAYGRAVSVRLVGGPMEVDCLNPNESSGLTVGWSDWLALVLTAALSDQPTTARGVGTYLFGQPPTGPGIRTAPYTTDFNVNPLTYDSIRTLAVPFGTGTVWASMLWQFYWELVEEHGFNADIYDDWTTGGNNLAVQLTIDAMKLVPCNPGFVDMRNAILQADQVLTGGANECAIWQAFADRGVGFSADQGSAGSVLDGTEAFDLPPQCSTSGVPEGTYDSVVFAEGGVWPNPFASGTSIRYTVREAQSIRLSVYDLLGRQVAVLESGSVPAGNHTAVWDGTRGDGEPAGSGVYFVRLESESESVTEKVVLVQ